MPTYTLLLHADARGVEKKIEFEGQTAASALTILETHADACMSELWSGDEKLADLMRDRSGLWLVQTVHHPVGELT